MSVRGLLLDISDEGAAILAGVDTPMGTRVHFEFGTIFEGRTVKVAAVVRNRRKYIYGVELLTGIDCAENQKLRKLKSTLLSMGSATPARLDDRRPRREEGG
jgi:PilZ domain